MTGGEGDRGKEEEEEEEKENLPIYWIEHDTPYGTFRTLIAFVCHV